MSEISFIIPTVGNNYHTLDLIIKSIEHLKIPNYEVIIIGGSGSSILEKNNVTQITDDQLIKHDSVNYKKMQGVRASKFETSVICHDYFIFDHDWYIEFVKFGTDWDICIQKNLSSIEQGSTRGNGWRAGPIPGYPEIPFAMCIPWDIDCFIPYMPIHGAYWVAKRSVMLETPLDESLSYGQQEDIEWSSRVVPGWLGQKPEQNKYKIVSNPKCITRYSKYKEPYPGNPDWDAIEQYFNPLWDALRAGLRRSGVYHYESSINKIVLSS